MNEWMLCNSRNDMWGPFATADAAWDHLFGRPSTEEERAYHHEAGWRVMPSLVLEEGEA